MDDKPNLHAKEINFTVWPSVLEVKVAKLDPNAVIPFRKFQTDAGMDVYSLNSVLILPHRFGIVRTGITVEIPQTYFGLLKPKSSNWHLVGAGVIDESYQGEIIVKVCNITDETISFLPGQPIAQLILIPVTTPTVVEVTETEIHQTPTERGESGGIHGA